MPTAEPPPGAKITYRRQYRRCGKPGCSVCSQGSQGHGPYWYAYWSEGGRMHSRYVGKEAPAELKASDQQVVGTQHAPVAPRDSQPTAVTDVAPLGALRVRTLGGFDVWRGEELIPPDRWNRRKVATL